MNKFLIITSINDKEVFNFYQEKCNENNIDFVIIGDNKTPKLNLKNFISIDQQKKMPFELCKNLPENHYSRKNLGYLHAIKNNADVIIETDDDNYPYDSFFDERTKILHTNLIENQDWINIYKLYTNDFIWPRGFSLNEIKNDKKINSKYQKVICPIQQGLANLNPDVDAIFRLINKKNIFFSENLTFAIGNDTICPFNSQNTTWFKEVFPLMYLPSYCNFRSTDIWRGYIAQIILWNTDYKLLFTGPTLYQIRNEHNIMKDFNDEFSLYLETDKVIDILKKLNLKKGNDNIIDNMILCYESLIKNEIFPIEEMYLLKLWIKDINV